jgi:hypothetical protein
LKPIFDKVTANFAVTVDFPTPPFPEATAVLLSIPVGFAFDFREHYFHLQEPLLLG